MAIAASLLRSEMRRHLMMNVGLIASCVVGATVVTNERGLFVPLTIHGMSDTARAFAAMFTQSHLLPDNQLTDIRMVSPLEPFEVTADSRDLRRRLMDSLSWLPEQASEYNKELAQVSPEPLIPTEFASNLGPNGQPVAGSQPPAAGSAAPAAAAAAPAAPAVSGGSPLTGTTSDILPSSSSLSSPDVTPAQADNAVAASQPVASSSTPVDAVGAVPEPSIWAMLIAGFGLVGYFLRAAGRRRKMDAEPVAG